jgi:cyanophycin synthetase
VADAPGSLVELRVLEGPNLYFPRAAIKLTLDIGGLAAVPEDAAQRFARRIGLPNARPGAPHSGFRQRFALRAVGRLVRAIATESGSTRLAVRVRPTNDPHRIVVAFPWRHRNRAQVMGEAIAEVLDAVPGGEIDAIVDGSPRPRPAPPRTRSRPGSRSSR